MAEKYRLPKITLTDDAKQLMLHYKWPGNVRQLKNITEQMSVLSEKREIDANDLKKFIPDDPDSTELATISKPGQHSYESEREILYKILYELRGNITDLRRDLTSMRKQLDEEREIRQATVAHDMIEGNAKLPSVMGGEGYSRNVPYNQTSAEDAEAEEIKTEEPESLNLNDLGRQMVEKALERNDGNRKKAAQELGISDRTLYRRIKQYGLDKKEDE
jgi:DNA-binding NtrC family response regulator